MLYLLSTLWILGNLVLANGEDGDNTYLYATKQSDIGKCLDFCHLRLIPYLLCKDEEDHDKLVSSPKEACSRGHCDKDDFKLHYETRDGLKKRKNYVKKTKVWEYARFKYLCLDEKGLPQRLKCEIRKGDREWQETDDIICRDPKRFQNFSSDLNNLVVENPPDIIPKLSDLLRQSNESLSAVDVASIADIFGNVNKNPERNASLATELIGINIRVMETEKETLHLSAEQNATNILLSNFEDYLDELAPQLISRDAITTDSNGSAYNNLVKSEIMSELGVLALTNRKLSVFFVNPEIANVTGIAVSSSATENNNNLSYKAIYSSDSTEDVRNLPNLETAAFLPDKLWQAVKQRGATYLIFKVYKQDVLFVETEADSKRRPTSAVISITISGLEDNKLPLKLPIFLRNANTDPGRSGGGCGYWNYKTWLSDGVSTQKNNSLDSFAHPVILCHADHLTQFTFLLGVAMPQTGLETQEEAKEDSMYLDVITNVGVTLSLMGISAIFLTAALFKGFRNLASTKILLNFCLALVLQLLLFVIVSQGSILEQLNPNPLTFDECLIMGALMQYLLLVVFSWMLIIGFLQYKRYVKVLGVGHPEHYILISAIVAWTLPLIPTLLVVFLDPSSYRPRDSAQETPILCYPSGYGLTLGVILPIGLVTVTNALIVGYISFSIYKALIRRRLVMEQLRLFVLLFFLLGITWIFGLCSVFNFGIVFSYLFCITATMQGFVLFVFFVIFNKDNRRSWLGLCCHLRKKSGQETIEMPTESTAKSFSQLSSSST
ncbi:hypothetical protein KR009_010188 [Drosophila setifemur]|nr:hypothetical protein KR009_010188 [Drosophila setifemur]